MKGQRDGHPKTEQAGQGECPSRQGHRELIPSAEAFLKKRKRLFQRCPNVFGETAEVVTGFTNPLTMIAGICQIRGR